MDRWGYIGFIVLSISAGEYLFGYAESPCGILYAKKNQSMAEGNPFSSYHKIMEYIDYVIMDVITVWAHTNYFKALAYYLTVYGMGSYSTYKFSKSVSGNKYWTLVSLIFYWFHCFRCYVVFLPILGPEIQVSTVSYMITCILCQQAFDFVMNPVAILGHIYPFFAPVIHKAFARNTKIAESSLSKISFC